MKPSERFNQILHERYGEYKRNDGCFPIQYEVQAILDYLDEQSNIGKGEVK